MKGRMRPYLPELTIRDYNTYMRYLRGVRRQMYKSYGFYACHLLRTNGVLFAILSDSLAGRMPTCKRQRVPGTLFRRGMMCQTLGIRQAAQTAAASSLRAARSSLSRICFCSSFAARKRSSVSRRRNSMR